MRNTNVILVEHIRECCKNKGISVSRMEADLEFSQGLISRWTKMSPTFDRVLEVARYLDVSLDDLLGRTRKKTSSKFQKRVIEATEKKEIWWIPYTNRAPFEYPLAQLKMIRTAMEWEAYYCRFGNGFFIVVCISNTEKLQSKYECYGLTETTCVPVRLHVNEEDLAELWDLIEKDDADGLDVEDFFDQLIDDVGP